MIFQERPLLKNVKSTKITPISVRATPKTMHFLASLSARSDVKAMQFFRYSSVGWGTSANLAALLSGCQQSLQSIDLNKQAAATKTGSPLRVDLSEGAPSDKCELPSAWSLVEYFQDAGYNVVSKKVINSNVTGGRGCINGKYEISRQVHLV